MFFVQHDVSFLLACIQIAFITTAKARLIGSWWNVTKSVLSIALDLYGAILPL